MRKVFLLLLLVCGVAGATVTSYPPWGFYGHRRINRLAVFTLPPELGHYFRAQADYLAEHAVDPDKRRYATAHEAVRHYIDLDHWGQAPFTEVPRRYVDALLWQGGLDVLHGGDTTHWRLDTVIFDQAILSSTSESFDLPLRTYRDLWYRSFLPALYEERAVATDSLRAIGFPDTLGTAIVVDELSAHGILPYHLVRHHRQLTEAFVVGDVQRIRQLAAEIGHYVGDAHVPLHTTENYNGQLSGQLGIHAFWESRLPELFADRDYDYLVGPADYIVDPTTYYWDIVLESHALVDSVLSTEAHLRQVYPVDQQFCFEERLGREVRTQCREYAAAWSDAMDGMVEARFRAAIHAVGSVWYSCWVDAGQPNMQQLLNPATGDETADSLNAAAGPPLLLQRTGRVHE
ncbi:hypothetical protein LEM8419_01612 [Neolewinella maritima]|uniref:S1/P1 Nuclease n=1 Tax=Neolewinella maritima TaxID=1383882 RepID=A0ABN8F8D5_9BACT|nr:zinc dependent phospholipase C family protein [Neolewinella maritima]CAH1000459.1 hypothetical protein LEM8419_01612 [Neolewinella maritima]